MARLLRSYVCDTWITPTGEGTPIRDAVTGEEIARVSADGIDVAAALDHARNAGGPALRELTFLQRSALLKAVATHIKGVQPELMALSTRTGATRRDAGVDVVGGISTAFSFASQAKRGLDDTHVAVEGPVEGLSRGGSFVGRHILTPRHGVAIQINAFNFPVWGPLEKLAPALLAGMPVLVKPADQTAYLTERLVEAIVDSQLLPPGSISLVCGLPGDLLDHCTSQDVVAFTGSADTGRRLRAHPRLVERSTRFTAEADSLNAAILGPDVAPGSAAFDRYVDTVVDEMVVKAGQKCTAVRRALVPTGLVDAVAEAVGARLGQLTVGDPSLKEVDMGPLVSLEQREEVRRSLKALTAAGRVAFGDPDHVEVHGADHAAGGFVSPVLCVADADVDEPHVVEAFGPVSTVIGYDGVEQAVELAARGDGSLVASLVTDDADVAQQVVVGAAPHHGRILVLDQAAAPESTGHGSPLPMLVHGGPGRAGGGEELGGLRAVFHHLQRTAVQASPDMLTAVTGQWVHGAARRQGRHPFRMHLEELSIGDSVTAGPREVTLADIEHFAEFTGDTFYAHMDDEAAAANPFFEGRVAHGYLLVSWAAGLFVDPDPGPVLANAGLENLRFLTPVVPGDALTVTLTAKAIRPRLDTGYGEVRWDCAITNGNDEPVATYDVITMVAKRPG